ncbi:MAG: sensor histidine kinase [Eubacterium sp.]|nr:sensor histidine kinase [Eubacterium sp.]
MKRIDRDNRAVRRSRLGIKGKILLFLTAVIVPFTVLISILIYQNALRRSTYMSVKHAQDLVGNTEANLTSYLDELSLIPNECNYNYYIQEYLKDAIKQGKQESIPKDAENLHRYEMFSSTIETTLQERSDTTSIRIFGKNRQLLAKTIYPDEQDDEISVRDGWYRNAVAGYGDVYFCGPEDIRRSGSTTKKGSNLILSSMIRDSDDGSFLGVVRVDFNLNKIAEFMDNITIEDYEHIGLLNQEGKLIYEKHSGNNLLNEKMLAALQTCLQNGRWKNGFHQTELCGTQYHIVMTDIPMAGWTIVDLQPHAEIVRDARGSSLTIEIVVLLIFAAILILLNSLLNRIVNPIVELQRHMNMVTLDNDMPALPVDTQDELGMLVYNFNRMTNRINHLSAQLMEEQKKKRQYELQALQAQINPHFIYNTLDSIIWMAELQDPNVVPMTEALAKLMRISLSRGREFIPVADEMEQVRNYLVIQSMRYQDKFDYSVETAEDVRQLLTIKLIVQPLVENSIYHGIKEKEGKCHLDVRAFREGKDLVFLVRDDGLGMDEKTCASILTERSFHDKPKGKGNGIGVFNVNERIQLEYGKDYGVSYRSEVGKGTEARICIPCVEENKEVSL